MLAFYSSLEYNNSYVSRKNRSNSKERLKMNIYVDESGSINNHIVNNKYFVIALIRPTDTNKLRKVYKRFVASNLKELLALDQDKLHPVTGKLLKKGGKMFQNGNFLELKGCQFDNKMKKKFVDFFCREPAFELYYIKLSNELLTDRFCSNTARAFNYALKIAIDYFIRNSILPREDCFIQLDERNEKDDTKYFLENYLNTELFATGATNGEFRVAYYDSAKNRLIQIADVFANLLYSHLKTNNYGEEIQKLYDSGVLKFVFEFPKHQK